MKNISRFLIMLILLQSCNAYHPPTTVEEAVAADKKAKVITTDKQRLKFKRLESRNGNLTGLTKPGSSTAKKLADLPAQINGEYAEIDLSSLDIEKIKLRNKTGSTVLTVVTVAGIIVVTFYTAAIIAFTSFY